MKKTLSISVVICLLLLSGCNTPTTHTPAATVTPIPPTEEEPVESTETPLPPTEAPAAPTYSNVAYMDDDNPEHMLDIYLPSSDNTGEFPTLLMLHGSMNVKENFVEVGDYFADQGYAIVITEFEYGVENRITLQNAFCSLAWVYANADKYDFDPERIYLFGFSLGGLLSASLGSFKDASQYQEGCPNPIPETDQLRGVITYAGMFVTKEVCLAPQGGWCMAEAASINNIPLMEMANIFETLREVPSSDWKDSSELSEAARDFARELPLYWLDGSEPKFLIIHGDADDVMPIVESEAFARAVQSAGGDAEFITIPGAGHFSLNVASPSFVKIAEEIEAFVSEQ